MGELERRVLFLERLLLESPTFKTRGKVPAGKEAWRQLKQGLTESDVRRLFGEPERVNNMGVRVWWYYGTGSLWFDNGRLAGWTEP